MKDTLEILFQKSIKFWSEGYSNKQIESKWLGNPPATIEEIENTEKRLGVKLPQDYIELVTSPMDFLPAQIPLSQVFKKWRKLISIETLSVT